MFSSPSNYSICIDSKEPSSHSQKTKELSWNSYLSTRSNPIIQISISTSICVTEFFRTTTEYDVLISIILGMRSYLSNWNLWRNRLDHGMHKRNISLEVKHSYESMPLPLPNYCNCRKIQVTSQHELVNLHIYSEKPSTDTYNNQPLKILVTLTLKNVHSF